MHGLFYCAICFSDFATKDELTSHEQGKCGRYRCLRQDCPDYGRLVVSSCRHHRRKNTQEEIYQYLRNLARTFRDPLYAQKITVTSKYSSTEALPPATTAKDASEWYHPRGDETSSLSAMASSNLVESTEVNTDIDDRISTLESLISRLWNKLETGDSDVDVNLRTLYRQAVPDHEQAVVFPDHENPLQYRRRVLMNLCRQLWDRLHGLTYTPLDELRERVYDRVPHLQAQILQSDQLPLPLPGLQGAENDGEALRFSYDDALSNSGEPAAERSRVHNPFDENHRPFNCLNVVGEPMAFRDHRFSFKYISELTQVPRNDMT